MPVIENQRVGDFVLTGLRTEVLGVRHGSVIAIIDIAYDGGQHLLARCAQRVLAVMLYAISGILEMIRSKSQARVGTIVDDRAIVLIIWVWSSDS